MKKKPKVLVFSIILGGIVGILSPLISNVSNFQIVIPTIISFLPVLIFIIVSNIKQNGEIDLANPMFLYGAFYFVFFGIGGYLYKGAFQDNAGIGGIATIIGVIGYTLGYLYSKVFHKATKLTRSKNITLFKIKRSLKFEGVVFLIGLAGFLLYIIKMGNIPIFMNNLEQSRVDASQAGGAKLRIISYLLILSASIGFLNIRIYKKKFNKTLKMSLVRYILSILLLFTLANRSPIYNIFFSSFLIYLFVQSNGKVKIRKIIPLSIIALLLVVTFVGGVGAYRVLNTEDFYSYPEFRLYISNKDYIGLSIYVFSHYLSVGFENLLRVIQVVPNNLSYKLGLSYIEPLLTILPGKQYTLDMQIKMALGQGYLGGGTVPSVLGEAFANFGFIGWFIVPFFSMIFLRFMYIKYLRDSSNMFTILIYTFLLGHFSNSLLSGLASSSILPFVSLFVYLWYGFYINKNTFNWTVKSYDPKFINNDLSA